MKEAPVHLLYESAYRGNIIPITSVCNVSCVFCSHRQNPPEIQIYRIKPLNPGQVEEILQFISPEQKIVIGESVTRIIEGEPLTNPHFIEILTLIRRRFPRTAVQITSNGSLIDNKMARRLADIGQIEINLSLNSSQAGPRQKLMKDKNPIRAVEAAEVLAEAGVPYHGSVVAMPHLTGWDDLGQTLKYLDGARAKTIRVFLPGFTRLAPEPLTFAPQLWRDLHSYVESAAAGLSVPVTVEPGLVKDLRAEIIGVIKGSPADNAGLLKKDTVIRVDGKKCFSRVEAFQRIKSGEQVVLDILRAGQELSVTIDKAAEESSGLVMEYDLDPEDLKALGRMARKYQKVWILASVLGSPALIAGLQQIELLNMAKFDYEIIPVPNSYFGGSIMSAGLLVVPDFIEAFAWQGNERLRTMQQRVEGEAIFVPSVAFDREGRDLTGTSFTRLEEATGYRVEII
ncbi:MAG: DUF512 domain-containing protein [Thermincola sp.]|nr:DUF512 domain-containing protein [Thermincola sp.]MDT3704545.1 DUF512 domain-containing protein [Thermincola sp.]